ncbi:MAG: energy transducer TonB [Candidatus Acidiferrales bacterium]
MDFRGPDKYWSPFAAWLADRSALSFGTAGYPLTVIERAKLSVYEPIEGYVLRAGTAKSRVALELGADTIVEGFYSPAENGIAASLNAYRVSDLENATAGAPSIAAVHGNIPFTREIGPGVYLPLDALLPVHQEFALAGQRVKGPICLYCPNPQYSSEAHKQMLEGTVLLSGVITADGRAIQVIVVKGLGSGLDEQAINDVNTWKFKPTTDADGRPIPVYCPIEVTFRLY